MIYLILFFISFFLTFSIKQIALKKSLLAIPNERSSHDAPTPYGGGIAIAMTWFLGLIYLLTCKEIDTQLFQALMVGFILSIVSFMDDLYEVSPRKRLLIQAIVGGMGLYLLGGLSQIDMGLFVIENHILTNGIAFLGILWFINLYNFLDGIDGYAGSEAVFLGLAGWFLWGGNYFLVLIASVLGFLVWNWPKAKIFMGDVGSTLLGYNVAIFAVYSQNHGTSILVWLILFGVFWFDATLTLARRYRNHEKLSCAHKKHAYQRVAQSGWSHQKIVIGSMVLNMVLVILGYISLQFHEILVTCFIITIALLYVIIKIIDSQKRFE